MAPASLNTPLIQKNRRRARLLLYLSPIVLSLLVWATTVLLEDLGLENDWLHIDYRSHESVRIFQDYLRFDTSYPTGNEIPAAEFLARELAREGFDVHLERLGHRNANLWAILEGDDPRALALHNHIDVDPVVRPLEWENPPFSGHIDLPFIYGRGAFDMKSLAVAQLMVMKELKREGRKPSRSLVFLATGDEERDSWLGTRYFLRHHPDVWERFDVVLTEGGAVEATDIDEVKYWGTEYLQKLFIEMRICSSNRPALEYLGEDLRADDLELRRGAELPPIVVENLRRYMTTRDRPGFDFRFEDALRGGGGLASLPSNVQAMMSPEISAFPVIKDPEGGYSMRVVLQLLPWESPEEALERWFPDGLAGFDVAIDIPHGALDPESLEILDHPIFDEISDVLEDRYRRVDHGRLFIPWAATDARFFRAVGVSAYGFSPFLILTSDAAKITGPNERIVAPAFLDGVELYGEVVRRWVE